MTIAQRIREYRYAKGWGPDELATRADISRTALYQIESGKTELPRASTLRRIAVALDVPMDALLDHEALSVFATHAYPEASTREPIRPQELRVRRPLGPEAHAVEVAESRIEAGPDAGSMSAARQRELMKMFADVLDSPFGQGVARIVEESYRMMAHVPMGGRS